MMNNLWVKGWEFEVGGPGMWPQDYDGAFIQLDDDLYGYVYLENNSIVLTVFNRSGFLNKQSCPIEHPTIPSLWTIEKSDKDWIVYCNQQFQFHISSKGDIRQVPIPERFFHILNAYHFSNDPFVFGDFIIEHKGPFGYSCSSINTQKKLWEIKVQGYLYTDMKRIDNQLFICTAEHGGFVYCFDINTGDLYYKIRTGGTAKIQFGIDYFVCYELGKNGKVMLVDIKTGTLLDSIELYKTTIDCPLLLMDNSYIITLSFKKQQKHQYIGVITGLAKVRQGTC